MAGNGPEQLRLLAARAKVLGDRGLLNATRAEIRAGAQPLIAAARQAALTQLPKSGGLAEYEASQRIRVSTLTGARSAGVRIVGKASTATDTGRWRHPDPSMRGYHRSYWHWSEQTYGPAAGWWSKTMRRDGAVVVRSTMSTLKRSVAESMAV